MVFRVGRTLVIVCCVSAAAVEFAAAADLPYVKSPPPAEVAASWAGLYLGGQVGYGMDSVRWRNLAAPRSFRRSMQ
jgi:opacity protein-like surface antigen